MTCVWEPDEDTLGDALDSLAEELQYRCLLLATSALQTLTYNRVGSCPITIRPVPENSRHRCGRSPRVGAGIACHCPAVDAGQYDIPGPVGYIESLKIDGVEQNLDGGDWRLDDGHLLVWQGDGPSPLPSHQDLSLPDSLPGTWSITYSRSYPVNLDGRMAVASLAKQFAEAFKPKGRCNLPRGVRTVARQGVSFTIEAGLFPDGLTKDDVADQFILKWAPAGSPTKSAQVFDPAKFGRNRVTSPIPRRHPSGSA